MPDEAKEKVKRKRLAQGLAALVSNNRLATLALQFMEHAGDLRPDNVSTIDDFLRWVNKATQKAHLIGYNAEAVSREVVYRIVAMNAVVSECTDENYEEQILAARELEDLSNVLRSGLSNALDRLSPETQLSYATRTICEAYIEQVHALGILP